MLGTDSASFLVSSLRQLLCLCDYDDDTLTSVQDLRKVISHALNWPSTTKVGGVSECPDSFQGRKHCSSSLEISTMPQPRRNAVVVCRIVARLLNTVWTDPFQAFSFSLALFWYCAGSGVSCYWTSCQQVVRWWPMFHTQSHSGMPLGLRQCFSVNYTRCGVLYHRLRATASRKATQI